MLVLSNDYDIYCNSLGWLEIIPSSILDYNTKYEEKNLDKYYERYRYKLLKFFFT